MKHASRTPGHVALRRGRTSIPGQTYLLTTTTHGRVPYFRNHRASACLAQMLDGRRLWRGSTQHAWVIMPDHVHALVTLGTREPLSKLVARVKAATATQVNRILGRTGPLWARAYHDHALRTEERIEQASRYLIQNPVRAGLAHSPWAWPYWNAQWLTSMDDLASLGEGPAQTPHRPRS